MTLTQLFTNIANAIRAKKGTSGTIVASNFPTEIASITTGVDTSDATAVANDIVSGKTAYANGQKITGNINKYTKRDVTGSVVGKSSWAILGSASGKINNKYFITDNIGMNLRFSEIASEVGLTAEKLKKDEDVLGIIGTYEGQKPSGEIEITENGTVDVSQYASANVNVSSGGDYNAKFKPLTSSDRQVQKLLTELNPLDVSNVTNMSYVFYSCTSLISVPEMDTAHITNMSSLCNGCTNLDNVPVLNCSNLTGLGNDSMFKNCTSLSNESLNNILAMCINMTKVNTKTLKQVGLSQEQATICQTLSNWDDFVAAGWTTGY